MCREPKPRGQRRSGAAIAAVLLVIAATSGNAQGPADVAAHRQLIDEYRAGRRVGDADISRLTNDPSLVGRIVEPTSGWSPVELTAAAMLHTDLALLRDPLVFVAVAAGILSIAALASLLPAWRVSGIDPAAALRMD